MNGMTILPIAPTLLYDKCLPGIWETVSSLQHLRFMVRDEDPHRGTVNMTGSFTVRYSVCSNVKKHNEEYGRRRPSDHNKISDDGPRIDHEANLA